MRGTLPVLYPVKSGPDGCSGSKSRTCCQAGPIFPAHASLNIVRLKERIYTLPDSRAAGGCSAATAKREARTKATKSEGDSHEVRFEGARLSTRSAYSDVEEFLQVLRNSFDQKASRASDESSSSAANLDFRPRVAFSSSALARAT